MGAGVRTESVGDAGGQGLGEESNRVKKHTYSLRYITSKRVVDALFVPDHFDPF